MPAYGSQATSNSQLQCISGEDVLPVTLLNAETPIALQASIAVAIKPKTASGGPMRVSVVFKCPGGMGAGVFQIQEADQDLSALDYTSINFGGATPGTVVAGSFNAGGTAKVTLDIRARFLRVLCTTAPGAAVTVQVSGS